MSATMSKSANNAPQAQVARGWWSHRGVRWRTTIRACRQRWRLLVSAFSFLYVPKFGETIRKGIGVENDTARKSKRKPNGGSPTKNREKAASENCLRRSRWSVRHAGDAWKEPSRRSAASAARTARKACAASGGRCRSFCRSSRLRASCAWRCRDRSAPSGAIGGGHSPRGGATAAWEEGSL